MTTFSEEDKQLCEELALVGVSASSVYDLVNRTNDYKEGVPILLTWLSKVQNNSIREGIVRALTIRNPQKGVPEALVIAFKKYILSKEYSNLTGWAFSNALLETATDDQLDDVLEIISQPALESAREMLAICLGKIGKKDKSKVYSVLMSLLSEPDMAGHAICGLGHLGDPKAIEAIRPFLKNKKRWISKEAEKAIRKLEKKSK